MKSRIEWTEYTWNPVTGCTKISAGCQNCYAEKFAFRLKSMGVKRYCDGFEIRLHHDLIDQPLRWKRPRVIFVNSMSDLFHEKIPDMFIIKAFNIMNKCPQHTFQVLTKRSSRLAQIQHRLTWSHNIWMGVSIENADYLFRKDNLLKTNAKVKFISFEPLLGPIYEVSLKGIDWIIVGGESGQKARKMEKDWVVNIKNLCLSADIPYFFKQWGGKNKKSTGRILDGQTWDEMPPLAHEVI